MISAELTICIAIITANLSALTTARIINMYFDYKRKAEYQKICEKNALTKEIYVKKMKNRGDEE